MGVAAYGTLVSVTAALVIAAIPASIFTTVIVKYSAELQATGDEGRLRALVRRALLITCAASLCDVAFSFILHDDIARYLNIGRPSLIITAGAILALSQLVTVTRGVLQGRQRFKSFAVSVFLEGGLRGALGIGIVALGYGVAGALAGWCLAEILSLAYIFSELRLGRFQRSRDAVRLDWRRIRQTCGGVGISASASTMLGFADMLLVKHFFSARAAGLYGSLSLCGRVLTFGLGFLPTILLPKAAAKAMHGEPAFPVLLLATTIMLVVSCGAICVAAVAPTLPLQVLVGNRYLGAAPLVLPYCVAVTFLTLTGLVTTYKIALHRFDFVAPLSFVALAEIVAINLWHASILQVVDILIASNFSALLVTSVSLRKVNLVSKSTA